MPDYRLEYIIANSPWQIPELGLHEALDDDDHFYTLSNGFSAVDLDVDRDALYFRSVIPFGHFDDETEYVDHLLLDDLALEQGTVGEPIICTDNSMAEIQEGPAIWTESIAGSINLGSDEDPYVVPEEFAAFERVPLSDPLRTTTDFKNALQDITGHEIWLTIQR